ncbi:MAG TPA: tripartite tricarboxylate transporter substrate-binding protein [Alphaproteobacteria bacterium]|nr:tripartite tricarboxylate transporter substrate-binding protein [Alphaproteobacteria bacterium]
MRARLMGAAVAAMLAVAVPNAARAQSPADFYKGKTVHFLVGTSTGGGFDTYARLLAPYMSKRLGATVLVENKPGGSHMVAMNAVWNATPDGLTLDIAPGEGAVLGKLLGEPGVRFDLTKFPIVARVNSAPRVLIINPKLPYRSLADILKADKTMVLSFAGKTDGASDTGTVFCHAVKMKCKALIGYPSSKEFTMAAMRGESDGTVLTEDSAARFSENDQLRPIVVTGRDRSAMMPNVPTVFEAVKVDDEGAWWLDFRDDVRKLGRLLVTTPGTPADRLAYLRTVLKEIETDPKVMKDFEDKGNPLSYGEPDEMAAIIARLLGGSISDERLKQIDYVITQKYYGG